VALGVHKHDLQRCDDIYKNLGTRIFSKPKASTSDAGESSWRVGPARHCLPRHPKHCESSFRESNGVQIEET